MGNDFSNSSNVSFFFLHIFVMEISSFFYFIINNKYRDVSSNFCTYFMSFFSNIFCFFVNLKDEAVFVTVIQLNKNKVNKCLSFFIELKWFTYYFLKYLISFYCINVIWFFLLLFVACSFFWNILQENNDKNIMATTYSFYHVVNQ